MKKIKLLLVAGARPNFMKIAPLIRAIRSYNGSPEAQVKIEYFLVHTGQHYDDNMSAIFFKELDIPDPDINLEVGSGSHAEQTARIMLAFEPVCLRERPDWVVVVGDVNSTAACSLVAAKLGIKIAHVEAGLRSFDRTMPEEINRLVTDALADLLLTPSEDADENLKREGIPELKIRFVGNIMIDTLVANLGKARRSRLPVRLGLKAGKFIYVTLHRPGNVDDPANLSSIMRELNHVSRRLPVVFPVHPRTRKMLDGLNDPEEEASNLMLLEPTGYHDSLWLAQKAAFVLTDSGGLQEESTYFKTPCLTLRPNTERPVTIKIGTNRLTNIETLAADMDDILHGRRPPGKIPKYWDGQTAGRVVKALVEAS